METARSRNHLSRWKTAWLSAFIAVGSASAQAQVFIGPGSPDSAVVLSNFASPRTPQLLIPADEATGRSATAKAEARPNPTGGNDKRARVPAVLQRLVDEVALEVGISADLLHAVISVESRYDPRAVSPRGAIGLMQLMPATAQRFGARDLYAPKENVLAGAQYLKWLMDAFAGDVALALAAYNAGEGAVQKAGGRIPPFAETRAYVTRVLSLLP